ncbi:MAG: response regulator, partial [Deltaproteobacteria bacterium]|nr:response regulator [Deltaproteobacteria bacterium]
KLEQSIIDAEVVKKTREADEFAHLLFDAMPVSCDLWDEECKILDCNEEVVRLFRFANKDEYRKRFFECSPQYQPDGRLSVDKLHELLDKTFKDGSIHTEWMHQDIHGEPIPMTIHAKIVNHHGKKIVAAYKYNMREELKAQEQAKEAEKKAQLMFSSMPLCCWMLYEDFTIIDCNQETINLFKLKGKLDSIGVFQSLLPEVQPNGNNSMEMAHEMVSKAFINGYGRFEWLHQTMDGEPIPCEVILVRSEYEGKRVILSYLRDLREQKKMFAAEAASYAKTAFLSNMSHEMRTPMNAIIGMTAIGKNTSDMARKDYAFEKIEDASTHLLGVINDVLDISKIEANMLELSPIEFDFERMLYKVVSVVNFRMNEKRLKFSVNVDGKAPRFIIGDDQRLAQVIMNLLSNAVKFTPEMGVVSLNVSLKGEEDGCCELRVEVADSGIGISREQQKKLFMAFSQAESGISRKFGGTGLGLVISKRIVELMGGELWVESELGEGARFIFTVKAERGNKTVKSLLAPGVGWDTIRILAVDDMLETREYFKDMFAHLHVRCDVAADGFEALRTIRENGAYDICFVDWRMPGMDGIELTKKIKEEDGKPCVVVMISAYNWDEVKDLAAQAGVDKYLLKPLLSSAILDCVNDCLSKDEAGQSASRAADGEFAGRRILLAEDIEINREIVLSLLEGSGMEIDCAETGVEALAMMETEPEKYDLIFMDVQMPRMDGLEATRRIRALPSRHCAQIPIIALTADVFKDDIGRCLAAGMNGHIGKPLDMVEVYATLRKYLRT